MIPSSGWIRIINKLGSIVSPFSLYKLIGKSLEAHVLLNVDDATKEALVNNFGNMIHQWLIVSKVSFTEETLTKYETIEVKVEKANGVVCPRCWNVTETEHEDGLCHRCHEILNK